MKYFASCWRICLLIQEQHELGIAPIFFWAETDVGEMNAEILMYVERVGD